MKLYKIEKDIKHIYKKAKKISDDDISVLKEYEKEVNRYYINHNFSSKILIRRYQKVNFEKTHFADILVSFTLGIVTGIVVVILSMEEVNIIYSWMYAMLSTIVMMGVCLKVIELITTHSYKEYRYDVELCVIARILYNIYDFEINKYGCSEIKG